MDTPIIPPKTREKMASEYGVPVRNFSKRISPLNIPSGDIFLLNQKRIYEHLGFPPSVKKSLYDGV